jgi:hypothetical protein
MSFGWGKTTGTRYVCDACAPEEISALIQRCHRAVAIVDEAEVANGVSP